MAEIPKRNTPKLRAVWIPPKRGGARCVRCSAWMKTVSTLPRHSDLRVRYHKCKRCGETDKTVEELTPES